MKNYLIIIALILGLTSCFRDSPKKVAIQPFGKIESAIIDSLTLTIQQVYGFKVITFPMKELPKSAFVNIKTPRYRADLLIKQMKIQKPDSIDFVLGVTAKDISTTKRGSDGKVKQPSSKYSDWGIFGLGYRPGPSCIISTYRIKSANPNKFILRLKKICMHELGHNLGLKHCETSEKCVMKDAAEKISTIDQVELKLCSSCKQKIK